MKDYMKYTDIQLKDKSTWRSYKQQWVSNNFQAVTETELEDKKLNAAMLNDVTSNITSLQGDLLTGAEDLKANKIPCQEAEPTLKTGQVWFAVYDLEEMGNYIKFTSKDGEFSISAEVGWDGTVDVNYTPWLPNRWEAWDGSSITAEQSPDADEYTILFRGYRNSIITGDDENNAWKITADGSVKVECHGNMENMLDYTVVQQGGHPTMGDYAFAHMFRNCKQLVTAPKLPFMTLSTYCYYYMFMDCRGLVEAPELPAITLSDYCYCGMFAGCVRLVKAPQLISTALASGCYINMFYGCSSMTTPPELPATTLASNCYAAMFHSCYSLTTAPKLPATTLSPNCYNTMFKMCIKLESPPELPATTLASYCYSGMFSGCSSLIVAPELPVTTLKESCYGNMFDGCTSLTIAPSLPAMILTSSCYDSMFDGCSNLKTPPELPATTLARYCYWRMFKDCARLQIIPELPAKTLIYGCYQNMFDGCTGIKLSETRTSGYSTPYRIPSSGTGVDATNALTDMFANTGGTFTGTPTINTTYYTKTSYIHFSTETPGDLTINVKNPGWDGTLEYSMDGEEWVEWDGSNITSADGSIYFRGSNNSRITESEAWNIFGDRVSCNGNIENLLDYEVVANGEHPGMSSYCYAYMFKDCTNLIEPPFLPATELSIGCYAYMFNGCTSLVSAPALPSTAVSRHAYGNMFLNCTSLVTAPSLPATVLDEACYRGMFRNCANLTSIPSLPATTLKINCYTEMFNGCTKIKLSTTQTDEYTQPYRIPTSGTGDDRMGGRQFMFKYTGGTFTGDPEINTTYYLSSSNTIV